MNQLKPFIQSSRQRPTMAVVLTLAVIGSLAYAVQADTKSKNTVDTSTAAIRHLRSTSEAFSAIDKAVSPAVVSIQVERTLNGIASNHPLPFNDPFEMFGEDFAKRFFGDRYEEFKERKTVPEQPRQKRISGQGSGFIVTPDGVILTNHHVVGEADKVMVQLKDGREYEAKLIGSDPRSDVAVIKIDDKNLPVIPLADSDRLDVGEWVLAFGSPFGLTDSMTAGIVSAKGRTSVGIADYENFIQTDAAINPGNSGGPLVNLDGQVVGINTAIASRSGGYQGIGFAIPINLAKNIRDQLINEGTVRRGFLGIMIQKLTPDLAKSFGLSDTKGVLIGDVSKDSPSGKAGLQSGDVIVELNGKPVVRPGVFRNRVAMLAPETDVTLTVLRNGQRKSISVTLGVLPNQGEVTLQGKAQPENVDKLGLSVQNLSKELASRLGYSAQESGVVVNQVASGSLAALAGIKPGMLIREVDRQSVHTVAEFRQAVKKSQQEGVILLRVQDKEFSRYLTLRWED